MTVNLQGIGKITATPSTMRSLQMFLIEAQHSFYKKGLEVPFGYASDAVDKLDECLYDVKEVR